ncbi:MAG: helix-turn-helix domain-containing protein, partial [Sciscionella sp.]
MATVKGMVGMRPEKNLVFGRELRRLRLARGLSQPQLAALIPTDPTYISKVENGHRIPALGIVRAWDEALEAGGRLAALLTVQGA